MPRRARRRQPIPQQEAHGRHLIETDAFLCDKHALSGGTLALLFEPDDTEDVKVEVLANRPVEARSKHIKQPDEVSAES